MSPGVPTTYISLAGGTSGHAIFRVVIVFYSQAQTPRLAYHSLPWPPATGLQALALTDASTTTSYVGDRP